MADTILEQLESLRRPHLNVEGDCWFSCPKSGERCGSDEEHHDDGSCDCGADPHNAILDQVIERVRSFING